MLYVSVTERKCQSTAFLFYDKVDRKWEKYCYGILSSWHRTTETAAVTAVTSSFSVSSLWLLCHADTFHQLRVSLILLQHHSHSHRSQTSTVWTKWQSNFKLNYKMFVYVFYRTNATTTKGNVRIPRRLYYLNTENNLCERTSPYQIIAMKFPTNCVIPSKYR